MPRCAPLVTSVFEASAHYMEQETPLVVLAGKEYGSGSSRDWAAKGPNLLGVRAVIAESFERIHRSNLVGMGVLPLQFQGSDTWQSLRLTGEERVDVIPAPDLKPQSEATLVVTRKDGSKGVMPHFIDRAKPGVIAVMRDGRRFANEGNSYHDFVQDMIKAAKPGEEIAAFLAALNAPADAPADEASSPRLWFMRRLLTAMNELPYAPPRWLPWPPPP